MNIYLKIVKAYKSDLSRLLFYLSGQRKTMALSKVFAFVAVFMIFKGVGSRKVC